VRAQGVAAVPNRVLHPWLKAAITAIRATPAPSPDPGEGEEWWGDHLNRELPPPVNWLWEQGVIPLYTPLSGSWLNMAESVQRILVRRALAGQHPQSAQEVIRWLDATVAGWNRAPTPFSWKGKRHTRRRRARLQRVGGIGRGDLQGLLNCGVTH